LGTCDGAPAGIILSGLEASPIEGIHFENVTLTAKKGVLVKNARDLSFKGLKITTSEGAVFDLTNTRSVTIRHTWQAKEKSHSCDSRAKRQKSS
jgi:hypothetical protein